MIRQGHAVLVVLCLAALSGCAQPAKRSDLLVGSFLRSTDVERVGREMAASLAKTKVVQARATPPTLALAKVENNTVQYFFRDSKEMFSRSIRTTLVRESKGKLTFVDLEREDEIRQKLAELGGENEARAMARRWGVDYLLSAVFDEKKGEVAAGKDKDETGVYSFLLMTFTLTDAETGQIVWTDDYKVEETIAVPPWVTGG